MTVHEGAVSSALGTIIGSVAGDPALAALAAATGVEATHATRRLLDRIRARRRQHFGTELVERSSLPTLELVERVGRDPVLAELVLEGFELSERASSDWKRRHYAEIVAGALRSPLEVDAAVVLLRSAAALEAYDVPSARDDRGAPLGRRTDGVLRNHRPPQRRRVGISAPA